MNSSEPGLNGQNEITPYSKNCKINQWRFEQLCKVKLMNHVVHVSKSHNEHTRKVQIRKFHMNTPTTKLLHHLSIPAYISESHYFSPLLISCFNSQPSGVRV